jgi:hypothetical protein
MIPANLYNKNMSKWETIYGNIFHDKKEKSQSTQEVHCNVLNIAIKFRWTKCKFYTRNNNIIVQYFGQSHSF